jgi:hypothetical protein
MQVPAGVSIGGSDLKLYLASIRRVRQSNDANTSILVAIDRLPRDE